MAREQNVILISYGDCTYVYYHISNSNISDLLEQYNSLRVDLINNV